MARTQRRRVTFQRTENPQEGAADGAGPSPPCPPPTDGTGSPCWELPIHHQAPGVTQLCLVLHGPSQPRSFPDTDPPSHPPSQPRIILSATYPPFPGTLPRSVAHPLLPATRHSQIKPSSLPATPWKVSLLPVPPFRGSYLPTCQVRLQADPKDADSTKHPLQPPPHPSPRIFAPERCLQGLPRKDHVEGTPRNRPGRWSPSPNQGASARLLVLAGTQRPHSLRARTHAP